MLSVLDEIHRELAKVEACEHWPVALDPEVSKVLITALCLDPYTPR